MLVFHVVLIVLLLTSAGITLERASKNEGGFGDVLNILLNTGLAIWAIILVIRMLPSQ